MTNADRLMFRLTKRLVLLSCVAATVVGSAGCASVAPSSDPLSDAIARYHRSHDYYALLEIVDTHIDPAWYHRASKADVVKLLGEGMHGPDDYPGAGPNDWVYTSSRPIPIGSYLYITFGDDGFVKDVSWGSE